MDNQKIIEAAKHLFGLSPNEWLKLKLVVDSIFERKRKEYELQLTLDSVEEIETTIRSQFG